VPQTFIITILSRTRLDLLSYPHVRDQVALGYLIPTDAASTNQKKVQKLTGRIAMVNRFIASMAERRFPFFSVVRGSARLEWGPKQQKAFGDFKLYLQQLPTLSSLEQGQPLILYVSATHSVVSEALVIEKDASKMGKITKQ
jgi:hypothetical protein